MPHVDSQQYVEELAKTFLAAGMDVRSAYTEAMGFDEEGTIRYSPFMFAKDIGQEMAELRKWRNKVSRARTLAKKKGVQLWYPTTHQKEALELASRFEKTVLGQGWTFEADNPVLPNSCAGWEVDVGASSRYVSWVTGVDLCEANESGEGLATAIRLYVEHQVMVSVPPDASQDDLLTVTSAVEWVANCKPMLLGSMDYRSFLVLGSEEDVFRWALLYQVKPSQKNAGRHSASSGLKLNISQLQRAKKSPEERLKVLPLERQWERILKSPAPVGLRIPCMTGFKAGALTKLCEEFKVSLRLRKDLGYLQPLVNLVSLFGAVEAIKRFVKAKGFEWTKDGVHDAGQFVLPTEVPLAPEWAQLCLKHPEATEYAGDFLKVQKAYPVPATLSGLRKIIIGFSYPTVRPGFEQLVDLCHLNKISGTTFDVHQKFWESVTVKDSEFLPYVHIKGEEVGIDSAWEFVKLAASDFRGPLLGMLTGCCQHLEAAGSESAKQGVTSPFSGFYVVLQNGKVMAQSWAWRTHTGGIVFDSIEGRFKQPLQLENIGKLYLAAAKRLVSGPLGVNAVFLGNTTSGITSTIAGAILDAKKMAVTYEHAPAESKGYFDGAVHYLLAGKPRNRPDPGMAQSGRMVAKKRKPPRKWEPVDVIRGLQRHGNYDAAREFRNMFDNEFPQDWFRVEAD